MTAVLPRYGSGALCDVLTGVAARLGVPDATDVLDLPPARTYVVVLVDGLGWELLGANADRLPYLGPLAGRARPLTAGVPSTTVTSLTSLGTGLPPGEHGIAGFRFRLADDRIFCPLTWDGPVDASELQPRHTLFERVRATGLGAAIVVPAYFEGTGLTDVALRGATLHGLGRRFDEDEWLAAVVGAVAAGPGVVYAYERELDHDGHEHGLASWQWADRLSLIDETLERLRAALPDDVRIVVTGDHGMLDVPADRRVVLEDDPRLALGVSAAGGEGRFRHLYTAEPEAVAARWADVLGDRAWVRTRPQATAEGWFGPLDARVATRFGDVVVAMRDDWAVLLRSAPREWSLVGMHASLTPAEMLVPLLLD